MSSNFKNSSGLVPGVMVDLVNSHLKSGLDNDVQ